MTRYSAINPASKGEEIKTEHMRSTGTRRWIERARAISQLAMPPAKKVRGSTASSTTLEPAKKAETASSTALKVTVHIDAYNVEDSQDEDEFGYDEPDDDTLGSKGEYGTRHFSANIKVNGKPAGTLSGRLLDRPSRSFHAACDADSQELQEMGCVLFGSDGRPRNSAIKSDASTWSGGFLYISSVSIATEFRKDGATDVGAAAVGALLRHPDLGERWTVAAYIADSSEWMTPEDEDDQREMRRAQMAQMMGEEVESAVDPAKHAQGVCERMAKDARQFVRAGFRELDYQNGGWLYMTKGMLAAPLLTHEAALAYPLKVAAGATGAVEPADVPGPGTKDGQMLQLIARNAGAGLSDEAMLLRIDELITQGAHPTRAQALHCCAANDFHQLFLPLITRGADVNGKGPKGCTPLMVAAEGALGKVRLGSRPSSQAVATLIALGADKSLADQRGRTALGYHYASVQSINDFKAALIGGPKTEVDPTLKAMLMPSNGPTAADMECQDDH